MIALALATVVRYALRGFDGHDGGAADLIVLAFAATMFALTFGDPRG